MSVHARGDKLRRNAELLCVIAPYLGACAACVFSLVGFLGDSGCVNTVAGFNAQVLGGSCFTAS